MRARVSRRGVRTLFPAMIFINVAVCVLNQNILNVRQNLTYLLQINCGEVPE